MEIKLQFLFIVAISEVVGILAGQDFNKTVALYNDYHIYRITPDTESHIAELKKIDELNDSVMFVDGIHELRKSSDAVVAPHKADDFEILLKEQKIKFTLISHNLQADLQDNLTLKFDAYHSFDDANDWLHSLVDKYPGVVTIDTYARSYEGRELNAVKIVFENQYKWAIFVEAGMNGNEWIAPATALYLINELLTSTDPEIVWLARSFKWYIVPHVNPDGYEYSRKVDRMWSKTRSRQGSSYGVNLNRNFDLFFHDQNYGAISTPCSSLYSGRWGLSEVEASGLLKAVSEADGQIKIYLSLHGYGQTITYPKEISNEANRNRLSNVCDEIVNGLKKRYNSEYECKQSFSSPETSIPGNFMDHIYKNRHYDETLAYSYNLRPGNRTFETGFQLEEDQIIPNGEEFMDSLVAMIRKAVHYDVIKEISFTQPTYNTRTTKIPQWKKDL